MRNIFLISLLILGLAIPCFAEELSQHAGGALMSAPDGAHQKMVEDDDGNLQPGEYEVISPNGSITRALCPYTCQMRGLPKERCRTWQSQNDRSRCYVQDTAIPSNAVPLS